MLQIGQSVAAFAVEDQYAIRECSLAANIIIYCGLELLQVGVQPERKRADHDHNLRRFELGSAT